MIDPNDVLIRSLETQGIQRLYSADTSNSLPHASTSISTNNHKKELKKLNHSILIAYLDLLEVLIKAPTKELPRDQQQIDLNSEQQTFKTLRDQKLEDIELLFINMHHLINELRPHQARDNIRCILEMQKRQRIETAQKFKTHLFKIVEILKLCIDSIQANKNDNDNSNDLLKSDIFLDELNSLMRNANNLTKSLDSIDSINNKKITDKNDQTDVDMLQEDDSLILNKKQHQASNNGISNEQSSHDKHHQYANSNCDYKDLVLCDLIDDFLLKENEF